MWLTRAYLYRRGRYNPNPPVIVPFNYTFVFNSAGLLTGQGNWTTETVSGEINGLQELIPQAANNSFGNANLVDLVPLLTSEVWSLQFVVIERLQNNETFTVEFLIGNNPYITVQIFMSRVTNVATLTVTTPDGTNFTDFPSFPGVGGGDNLNIEIDYDPLTNTISAFGIGAAFGLAGFSVANTLEPSSPQLRLSGTGSGVPGTAGYVAVQSMIVTGSQFQ